jgi:hypothetical protein
MAMEDGQYALKKNHLRRFLARWPVERKQHGETERPLWYMSVPTPMCFRRITMPAKQLHFGTTARLDIQRGIDKLANAVKITLGPRGRNVVLDKSFGSPLSTKDGVTVAKEIELANRFENIGAQMVREVASKTSDVAGDGTTTATLLPRPSIVKGANRSQPGTTPWRSSGVSSRPSRLS